MTNAARRQLDTAITHAGAAAGYNTIPEMELHLHHVVNCIEGKSGKGYFKGSGDVCEGMGRGDVGRAKAAAQMAKLVLEQAKANFK